jgi:hypothetical protein
VVFESMSTSRPGLRHYTVCFENEKGVRCSCEGFCMHGHCWHVDSIPFCKKAGPFDTDPTKPGMYECVRYKGHDGECYHIGPEVLHEHDFSAGDGKCPCGLDAFDGLV